MQFTNQLIEKLKYNNKKILSLKRYFLSLKLAFFLIEVQPNLAKSKFTTIIVHNRNKGL